MGSPLPLPSMESPVFHWTWSGHVTSLPIVELILDLGCQTPVEETVKKQGLPIHYQPWPSESPLYIFGYGATALRYLKEWLCGVLLGSGDVKNLKFSAKCFLGQRIEWRSHSEIAHCLALPVSISQLGSPRKTVGCNSNMTAHCIRLEHPGTQMQDVDVIN